MAPGRGTRRSWTCSLHTDLAALRERVQRRLAERSVSFGSSSGALPFEVDPVPRVMDAEEWAHAEAGLTQRARALCAYVADVYSDRAIVSAGVVPERVLATADHHEPSMRGTAVQAAGCVAGLDLVRGADGVLRVLEDNFRTPSGIAYAAAAREAVGHELPECPATATRSERRLRPAGHRPAGRRPLRRRTTRSWCCSPMAPPTARGGSTARSPGAQASRSSTAMTCRQPAGASTPAWKARMPARSTWSTGAPTRTGCATSTVAPPGSRRRCSALRATGLSPWSIRSARAWQTTSWPMPTWRTWCASTSARSL